MAEEVNSKNSLVTELVARDVQLECPHCGETQDGFCGDPRGGTFICDDCKETYVVSQEADVELR